MPSYLSPKVKVGPSRISEKGLFAVEKIKKGEIVVDYSNGLGKYIDLAESDKLFEQGFDHMIQVDDDLFFAAVQESDIESGDLLNHSCSPNAGIKGRLQIVAMCDIEPGEEITIDYAMMESSPYEIKCNCGSGGCRGRVTGEDWKLPKLQEKYKGYFSDYLQRKIGASLL